MPKSFRVAVLAPNQYHCTRQALRGVAAFTREHPVWHLATEPWRMGSFREKEVLHCDGVISIWARKDRPSFRLDAAIPWVTIMDMHRHAGPRVMGNNRSVGRLAATHLLGCGLEHLAYSGYPAGLFSDQRQEGFVQAAEAAGVQVHVFSPPGSETPTDDYGAEVRCFEPWLRSLPLPVGILTANDARAITLGRACAAIGLRVPHQVAILGVDNDQLVCEFAIPTLSSIDPNAYEVGYQGAALLHEILMGGTPPTEPRLVEPAGLIQRGSTEMFAHEDPVLAEAFMYLRAHACEGIRVKDVIRAFPVARRTLEKVSRRTLGHSPHQEIRRIQIERAKELLAGSNLPVSEVARRSGLLDGKYLAEVFRKELDTTPSDYRRAARQEAGDRLRGRRGA